MAIETLSGPRVDTKNPKHAGGPRGESLGKIDTGPQYTGPSGESLGSGDTYQGITLLPLHTEGRRPTENLYGDPKTISIDTGAGIQGLPSKEVDYTDFGPIVTYGGEKTVPQIDPESYGGVQPYKDPETGKIAFVGTRTEPKTFIDADGQQVVIDSPIEKGVRDPETGEVTHTFGPDEQLVGIENGSIVVSDTEGTNWRIDQDGNRSVVEGDEQVSPLDAASFDDIIDTYPDGTFIDGGADPIVPVDDIPTGDTEPNQVPEPETEMIDPPVADTQNPEGEKIDTTDIDKPQGEIEPEGKIVDTDDPEKIVPPMAPVEPQGNTNGIEGNVTVTTGSDDISDTLPDIDGVSGNVDPEKSTDVEPIPTTIPPEGEENNIQDPTNEGETIIIDGDIEMVDIDPIGKGEPAVDSDTSGSTNINGDTDSDLGGPDKPAIVTPPVSTGSTAIDTPVATPTPGAPTPEYQIPNSTIDAGTSDGEDETISKPSSASTEYTGEPTVEGPMIIDMDPVDDAAPQGVEGSVVDAPIGDAPSGEGPSDQGGEPTTEGPDAPVAAGTSTDDAGVDNPPTTTASTEGTVDVGTITASTAGADVVQTNVVQTAPSTQISTEDQTQSAPTTVSPMGAGVEGEMTDGNGPDYVAPSVVDGQVIEPSHTPDAGTTASAGTETTATQTNAADTSPGAILASLYAEAGIEMPADVAAGYGLTGEQVREAMGLTTPDATANAQNTNAQQDPDGEFIGDTIPRNTTFGQGIEVLRPDMGVGETFLTDTDRILEELLRTAPEPTTIIDFGSSVDFEHELARVSS